MSDLRISLNQAYPIARLKLKSPMISVPIKRCEVAMRAIPCFSMGGVTRGKTSDFKGASSIRLIEDDGVSLASITIGLK